MDEALDQARAAATRGEVPVGAVIVHGGKIIAAEGNRMRERRDPTAHAEMLVIRSACQYLGQERLVGLDIYVTLEPCSMCAAAIGVARLRRLYFGASDPKSGGVLHGARVFSHPQSHHKPEVYDGVGSEAAQRLLREFFAHRREGSD